MTKVRAKLAYPQQIQAQIIEINLEKTCKKCQKVKLLIAFPMTKGNYRSICKTCNYESLKHWRSKHPEKWMLQKISGSSDRYEEVKKKIQEQKGKQYSERYLNERLKQGDAFCTGGCGRILRNRSICVICLSISDKQEGLRF